MLMEHAKRSDEAIDVIAAGGGLVGLMTAALLDVAGVRVELCERGSEPTRLRLAQPVLAGPDEQHRAAGRRQPGLELAATRTVRPDSHATHSVTVIPAVT
jgi:2-polyprenyl-6-methoxyphenol hydroxylase-like FAD-dependent oxidoreductase